MKCDERCPFSFWKPHGSCSSTRMCILDDTDKELRNGGCQNPKLRVDYMKELLKI